MKFGKNLISIETENRFFLLCEEDGVSLSEMRRRLEEIEENKDEIKGVYSYTITNIQERMDNFEHCPKCSGEFFYDEKNDERYCPVCDREH